MSASPTLALSQRTLRTLASGLALAGCYHISAAPARPRPSDEQVDIGYGAQSTVETGSAVQSLTAEEFMDAKAGRVEELFTGRFPGVRVLRTGAGGLQISIRGADLWSAQRQPLYVVDGMAVEVTSGRNLDWLVPEDIARVDVLKNAAETTMFGARGANGVVLITTKGPR